MKKLLLQIWPYIRPYKTHAIIAVLCLIPIAMTKAFIAYFIKNIIDGVFSSDATLGYAFQLASVIVGVTLLGYPVRYIHYYGLRTLVDQALCDLRRDLYYKFQNLPSSYFSEAKLGRLLSIMIDDSKAFANSFNSAISVIREPLTATALLGVMVYHDWKLTAVIFGIIPFFILIFNITGKRIKRYVERSQEDQSVMTHHANEGLTGQKIIKAFGLQDYMIKRFDQAQVQYLKNKKVSNSTEEHSHPLIELLISVAFGVVIVASFLRSQEGELTVGEFFSFIGAFGMFMDPVRRYSKANAKLSQAGASAKRVFELLNLKTEEDQGKLDDLNFNDSIEFQNVTFSYGKKTVLRDFSLKIKKGEKVGLVGLSGSGKSTALSLLLRLYDYEAGKILIDGVEIKSYKLKKLRRLFALVSQDVFLFNDSVEENVKAGLEFSDERFAQALKVSYSDEYIKGLPNGIKTEIGDRGLKLSGGQAQRLTIARAFLRDASVLLFDEATSALDNESEKIVQQAIDKVAKDKTVLAVAHRLSTIQNYDRIIVMKEGRKVQEGTHEELIASGGEYEKLYELGQ